MKNGFRKLLATLCALALLLASFTAVLADDENPASDPEQQTGQEEVTQQPEEGKEAEETVPEEPETPAEPQQEEAGQQVENTPQEEPQPEKPQPQEEESRPDPTPTEAESQLPGSDLPSEPEKVTAETENEETQVISEPVRIETEPEHKEETQPANTQPEEEKKEEIQPTEENPDEAKPEEENSKEENKEEPKPEEPETEEQGTEEPETEEPGESETDEEENNTDDLPELHLGKKGVEGALKAGQAYTLVTTGKYSFNIVLTLTLKQKQGGSQIPVSKDGKNTGLKITFGDREKELTYVENEDPASTDVVYQFTAYTEKDKTYEIKILSKFDADFTLTAARKQEEEKEEEQSEEQKKETQGENVIEEEELKETIEMTTEEPENMERANSDKSLIPKSVYFEITYNNGVSRFGEFAHFKAHLTGFDDVEYIVTWQNSLDGINWNDTEYHEETMDIEITEENCGLMWRIKVSTIE